MLEEYRLNGYPRFFKFDTTVLPQEWYDYDSYSESDKNHFDSLTEKYHWDIDFGLMVKLPQSSGYSLYHEDGSKYYYKDVIYGLRPTLTDQLSHFLIHWPTDCVYNGWQGIYEHNYEVYSWFPIGINSEAQEIEAVITHLLKIAEKLDPTIEEILDYQLHEQTKASEFLEYLKSNLDKAIEPDSVPHLRLKKRILKWYSEKVKEIEDLKSEEEEHSEDTRVEGGMKLKWTGSNRSLYQLFAQLKESGTIKHTTFEKELTPEMIAQFLKQSFEGLPQVGTITREIQKYLPKNGLPPEEQPPRDAIPVKNIDFKGE